MLEVFRVSVVILHLSGSDLRFLDHAIKFSVEIRVTQAQRDHLLIRILEKVIEERIRSFLADCLLDS